MPKGELYLTSFYFTITTVTTVGYGDISPKNPIEQVFGILLMVGGQVSFTYIISMIAQMMNQMEAKDARFQEKLLILNRIYREFGLPLNHYTKLKQSLRYKFNRDMEEIN